MNIEHTQLVEGKKSWERQKLYIHFYRQKSMFVACKMKKCESYLPVLGRELQWGFASGRLYCWR